MHNANADYLKRLVNVWIGVKRADDMFGNTLHVEGSARANSEFGATDMKKHAVQGLTAQVWCRPAN